MTDKELMTQIVSLTIEGKIIDALQDLGKRTLENDKALLQVTEALANKMLDLTQQVNELKVKIELLHMTMHQKGEVN